MQRLPFQSALISWFAEWVNYLLDLYSASQAIKETIGILPDLLNTIYLVVAALALVVPLGVGAAIYLCEYSRNAKMSALIEHAAEILSGIPSIIYGLVGMLFFCQFLD